MVALVVTKAQISQVAMTTPIVLKYPHWRNNHTITHQRHKIYASNLLYSLNCLHTWKILSKRI